MSTNEGYSDEKSRDKSETLGMLLWDGCLKSVQWNGGWNNRMKHQNRIVNGLNLEIQIIGSSEFLADLRVMNNPPMFNPPTIFTLADFVLQPFECVI